MEREAQARTEARRRKVTETDIRMGKGTQEWSREVGEGGGRKTLDGTGKSRRKGAGGDPRIKAKWPKQTDWEVR